MKDKSNLKLYAGVGIMTMALLVHMSMSIKNNMQTREVAINDFQRITTMQDLEEDKRPDKKKGR